MKKPSRLQEDGMEGHGLVEGKGLLKFVRIVTS